MAILKIEHSDEAMAFWTLFKLMKPEIKNEVRDMIVNETLSEADREITTDMMTAVSQDSFKEIWDAPENEHWNDFIKDRLEYTSKEI